jgi:hypothetical protein
VADIVDVPSAGGDLFQSNAYEAQVSVVINVLADGDGDGTADDPRVEFDATYGLIN